MKRFLLIFITAIVASIIPAGAQILTYGDGALDTLSLIHISEPTRRSV